MVQQLLFLVLVLYGNIVPSQSCDMPGLYYYELNAAHRGIYTHILQLELDEAQRAINKLKQTEPENVAVYHLENYIDFFTTFLLEREADLKLFEHQKQYRLDQLSLIADNNPYKRFAMAEVQLQWALARAKFGEEIKAGWDINKAYKWLHQNQLLFPDFTLNNKSLGLIHAMIGSVKGLKRNLIQLFTSLDGSIEEGLSEIISLYQDTDIRTRFFKEEIIAIRALTALHIENNPEEAYQYVTDHTLDRYDSSPVISFLRGSIARHAGKNDATIKHLDKSYRPEQLPLAYNELLLGTALLNRLDPRAKIHLERFTRLHQGRHYIKEAYQKLAWYHLVINNDILAYQSTIRKCLTLGEKEIGEDEMAYNEAKAESIPHKALLHAQLLYDGGSYINAKKVLDKIVFDQLSVDEQIIWHYRYGRCLQGLNDIRSLDHLTAVLNSDQGRSTYYACNAALQVGIISFEQERYVDAELFFDRCLMISPPEHRQSLHQKARLWLQKLKSRSSLTD